MIDKSKRFCHMPQINIIQIRSQVTYSKSQRKTLFRVCCVMQRAKFKIILFIIKEQFSVQESNGATHNSKLLCLGETMVRKQYCMLIWVSSWGQSDK